MIKLKSLLTEKSYKNSKDFGKGGINDRQYYTVTKTFTFQTPTGEHKGTGQHIGGWGRGTQELQKSINKKFKAKPGAQISYLPGGLFYIDIRKKQAMRVVNGTYSINDKFIEPRTKNIIDFSNWKGWNPYNKLEQR